MMSLRAARRLSIPAPTAPRRLTLSRSAIVQVASATLIIGSGAWVPAEGGLRPTLAPMMSFAAYAADVPLYYRFTYFADVPPEPAGCVAAPTGAAEVVILVDLIRSSFGKFLVK